MQPETSNIQIQSETSNLQPETGILILAAGASTRMGKPKQLLEFQGETLIQKVINIALTTACRPIIIVLGAHFDEIKLEIEKLGYYDIEKLRNLEIEKLGNYEIGKFRNWEIIKSQVFIIKNKDWQQGMSTSIKIGLKTLHSVNKNINAVLFLLADQPLLTTDYLLKLIEQQAVSSIIASYYNERLGVPALFDKKWFPELMQLSGDQGARKLLELHKDEVHAIPFPEGAFDVDTPEDYNFLMQQFE